jgi:transposase
MTTTTRSCSCDHGFPLCLCRAGITGDALLHRSRMASAHAGWPGRLESELVAAHDARMERERLAIADAARRRRESKPRIPLGTRLARPVPVADIAGDCGCGK